MNIGNEIIKLIINNPGMSNEEIAQLMRELHGTSTTGGSVASTRSRNRNLIGEYMKLEYCNRGEIFENAVRSVPSNERPNPPRASMAYGEKKKNVFNANEKDENSLPGCTDDLPHFNFEEQMGESDEEVAERIYKRFNALERFAKSLVSGKVKSLIVSGPPGVGKSFTIMNEISEMYPNGPTSEEHNNSNKETLDGNERHYDKITGTISAVGLYQALWLTRNKGVLVIDDCDDVFKDEVSLNLLKGAVDSNKTRIISWRKEANWLEQYGIPNEFIYNGSIVFLTNIDFETLINLKKKGHEHFSALIDRSMYLCLGLRTMQDFMVRLKQVCCGDNGILKKEYELDDEQIDKIINFIDANKAHFYNLSLRLVGQIAQQMLLSDSWEDDITTTKMKTLRKRNVTFKSINDSISIIKETEANKSETEELKDFITYVKHDIKRSERNSIKHEQNVELDDIELELISDIEPTDNSIETNVESVLSDLEADILN